MAKETDQRADRQAEKNLQDVEAALTRTEQFIEKHQKTIVTAALAIVAVVALVWVYNSLYREPMKHEAQANMFNAQYYFETDSFRLALEGDGVNSGFLSIIDEYGSSPAGKLAEYYAGVCYLRLGNFEKAKTMLSGYSGDDATLKTMAQGLVGDAEMELGNRDAAKKAYQKAGGMKNDIASPLFLKKLGDAYRVDGDNANALKTYQSIKEGYPRCPYVTNREIDKLIAMVK